MPYDDAGYQEVMGLALANWYECRQLSDVIHESRNFDYYDHAKRKAGLERFNTLRTAPPFGQNQRFLAGNLPGQRYICDQSMALAHKPHAV